MSKNKTSSDIKTGYYGYSSETDRRQKNTQKRNKALIIIGIILFIIQLGLSVVDVYLCIKNPIISGLNIFKIILICSIAVLILLLALVLFLLSKQKNAQVGAIVISIFVCIILAFTMYFILRVDTFLNKYSDGKELDENPFVVFVSANDTFGELNNKTLGRSDTNILAVVNPKTHNVLMISTPRDYYVPVQAKIVAPESYDKLTHVGLYGNGTAKNSDGTKATVSDWQWAYQVSWNPGNKALMDTLKYLYNFQIDKGHYHYVKLNFTGFAELIDALGGVTVNVDKPFSTTTYASYGNEDTGERKTYTYTKGKMKMDGATALTFARERHSFGNGDMQRNKNQVKVLKAIEKKAMSGNTLLHVDNVLDAVENSFSTDMDISSSVNLFEDAGSDGWNIMSFGVIGTPSRDICTYTGTSLSVVLQNQDSINRATNLINMTLQGKDKKEIKKTIKQYNKEQVE